VYVAFLDADDVWLPRKLELQVARMDADPTMALCGCQALWVRGDTDEGRPLFADLPSTMTDGWKRLLWDCYIATPCAMARRADLGPAPFDTSLRVGEDRDLWIRLARKGAVGLVPEPLARLTISPGSYMARHAGLIASDTAPMIERHLRAYAGEIGARERRLARGKLASDIGKALARERGRYLEAARHLLTAAAHGFAPLDSLRHLALSAPPIRSAADALRRGRRRLMSDR
jgi:hypothetical protein